MSLISAHNLSIHIGQAHVCQELDLSINKGENWAILGVNGSGKTTLLHTLAGLFPEYSGAVKLKQTSIQQLSRQYIAQHLGLLLQQQEDHFPGTVMESVLIGRHPHIKPWQWESEHDFELAQDALNKVGLEDFSNRSILSLSGGERQRVALATLLAQQTEVLLLDEPVNHLDIHQQHEVMKILTHASNTKANIFVLHDVNLATRYCDHVLLLFGNGKTIQGKCADVLAENNLTELYQYPIEEILHKEQRWFIPG